MWNRHCCYQWSTLCIVQMLRRYDTGIVVISEARCALFRCCTDVKQALLLSVKHAVHCSDAAPMWHRHCCYQWSTICIVQMLRRYDTGIVVISEARSALFRCCTDVTQALSLSLKHALHCSDAAPMWNRHCRYQWSTLCIVQMLRRCDTGIVVISEARCALFKCCADVTQALLLSVKHDLHCSDAAPMWHRHCCYQWSTICIVQMLRRCETGIVVISETRSALFRYCADVKQALLLSVKHALHCSDAAPMWNRHCCYQWSTLCIFRCYADVSQALLLSVKHAVHCSDGMPMWHRHCCYQWSTICIVQMLRRCDTGIVVISEARSALFRCCADMTQVLLLSVKHALHCSDATPMWHRHCCYQWSTLCIVQMLRRCDTGIVVISEARSALFKCCADVTQALLLSVKQALHCSDTALMWYRHCCYQWSTICIVQILRWCDTGIVVISEARSALFRCCADVTHSGNGLHYPTN
jgi:hypothetical protein